MQFFKLLIVRVAKVGIDCYFVGRYGIHIISAVDTAPVEHAAFPLPQILVAREASEAYQVGAGSLL